MTPRVLIIEDEYALAAALSTVVRRLGAEAVVAASGQSGLDKAKGQTFDVILLDIGLPDMSGLKVLSALKATGQEAPVLIITAHGTLENALEARRLGAHDYFLKPLNLPEMQSSLRALIQPVSVESASPSSVEKAQVLMIGVSPGMQRCFATIAQACAANVPVLLSGPRGSGKTAAAQVIQRNSLHAKSSCVTFRADEWPEEKVASGLQTALKEAREGTLIVEEIADLSLPLQAMLSRAMSTEEVRVLATSSVVLTDQISAGRFREDLYYQLAVLQLNLPPLKERIEDIEALSFFWFAESASHRDMVIAPETLACLKAYDWPGNVRELVTAMRHAAAVASGPFLLPRHLPEAIVAAGQVEVSSHRDEALMNALTSWLDLQLTVPEESLPLYDDLLANVEKQMLVRLLAHFDDKPTRMATALNMNRATLRRKLRELLGRD
jgi:DNA-binding NtrC family response regulator